MHKLAALLVVLLACGGTVRAPQRVRMSASEIVEKYKPAIVRIENDLGARLGVGTGFVVGEDGRIATNLHVIAGGGDLKVRLADGKRLPVKTVVAFDEGRDLAIIDVDAEKLPTVVLGDSDAVAAGDRVIAIGNPMSLDYTVSDGLISSVRPLDEDVVLQISAPISQGSSGGPLFNAYGEVIGVATLVSAEGQNLNFAVPSNYLQPLIAAHGGESVEVFARRFETPDETVLIETDNGPISREVPEHELSLLEGCSDEDLVEVFQGITRAIQLGAPVYNSGDHEACFVIYQQTARHFEKDEKLCVGIRSALDAGLREAESRKDFTAKAWAMRDTFDGLLAVIVRKAGS